MADANRKVRVIFEAVLSNFQNSVRSAMQNVKNGVNNVSSGTKEVNKNFGDVSESVNKVSKAAQNARNNISNVSSSAKEVNKSLKDAPESVNKVNKATKKTSKSMKNVSSDTKKANKNFKDMSESVNEATNAAQRLSNVIKTIVIGAIAKKVISAGADMADTFGKVERSLNSLSSIGYKELDTMKNAAMDFTNAWSGFDTSEFIDSAYAIKSGINNLSDAAVARFTEMAGITAKATKASLDEMTNLYAQGYEIYRSLYRSDNEYAEKFGAGIASSIKLFRTNGSEMSSMLSTLGATARTAGASLSDVLSVGGQLQSTMSGSEAATVMQSFYKNAYKAGKELNMQFTDSNGQLKGMADIIDLIHAKYGNVLDAAEQYEIQQAFGRIEAVKMVTQLYDKTGLLRERQNEINSAINEGDSFTKRMADTMNNGLLDKIDKIRQRWTNVKVLLGEKIAIGAESGIDLLTEKLETIQNSSTFSELGNNIGRLVGLIANDLVGAFSNADGWGKKLADSIGYIVDHYDEIKSMIKVFLELYVAIKSLSIINSVVKTVSTFGLNIVNLGSKIKGLWGLIAAHPIGALIAVIGLLILKFVDCYNKTGDLKKAFSLFCQESILAYEKFCKVFWEKTAQISSSLADFCDGIPGIGKMFDLIAENANRNLESINVAIDKTNGKINTLTRANIKPSTNTVKGFRDIEEKGMDNYNSYTEQKKAEETYNGNNQVFYEESVASPDDEDKSGKSATEKAIDAIAEKYDYQVDYYESKADLSEAQNNTKLEKQNKQTMISLLKQQASELLGLANRSSGKDKTLVETARNKILKQIVDITQEIKESVNNLIGSFNTPSDVSSTTQYQYLLKNGDSKSNKLVNHNNIEMNVSFDSLGELTEQEAYNKLSMLANMMGLVLTSKDSTVDGFMSDVTRNF